MPDVGSASAYLLAAALDPAAKTSRGEMSLTSRGSISQMLITPKT